MKSFTGLMVFASNGFNQARELVQFVKISILIAVLSRFVFRCFKHLPNKQAWQRYNIFGIKRREQELSFFSQYKALLCKAFIECHLTITLNST